MEGRTRTDGAVQVVFRAVLVPVARMLPCVCRIFAWPRLDLPIPPRSDVHITSKTNLVSATAISFDLGDYVPGL